jgi:hypothetical protein
MIAEKHHGFRSMGVARKFKFMLRKYLLIGSGPEPLDLFFDIAQIRNIMDTMAGIDAVAAFLFLPAPLQVDGHGPTFCWSRRWRGFRRIDFRKDLPSASHKP